MRSSVSLCLAAAAATMAVSTAFGGPLTTGNLVVMRVGHANPGGGGAVVIDEYSRSGSFTGNSIALPTIGADAFSTSDATNHDRHMHRSADGRFISFVGYNAAPGGVDPATRPSATVARVVGLLDGAGSVDLSTRLTSSYDSTSVRGAFTTNGTDLWIGGDNSGGATTTGGLHYTTRGSSSSVNLSQVQTSGGSHSPDNIRDVNAFGGQLFDSSGSSSSVGKAVFSVGSGMPTSGSQTLTTLTTDNVSQSSFFMLDLDPAIPGMDTMYTAGDNLRKYTKNAGGAWTARGFVAFNALSTGLFDQVIAAFNADGSVSVYAGGASGVMAVNDPTPLTGSLSGLSGSVIISAPAGYTLGGIEFSVPAPSSLSLFVAALPLARRRRR